MNLIRRLFRRKRTGTSRDIIDNVQEFTNLDPNEKLGKGAPAWMRTNTSTLEQVMDPSMRVVASSQRRKGILGSLTEDNVPNRPSWVHGKDSKDRRRRRRARHQAVTA